MVARHNTLFGIYHRRHWLPGALIAANGLETPRHPTREATVPEVSC